MKTVLVKLPHSPYSIRIGDGIVRRIPDWFPAAHYCILADSRLAAATRNLARELRAAGARVSVLTVAATEELKSLDRVYPLYGKLLDAGCDRQSVLVAVGGGVIGDVAGFVAATYMRGIRWIGVPTTLLAQIDSSIGGKTGVNHDAGKNLVGAFHQPALVVADTSFLRSLPERELLSGLGEMAKYGLIFDAAFFRWITLNWKRLLRRDRAALEGAIARCAQWKARAVVRDELDRDGVREVLNFGHTVGHAIEASTSYGRFRHGEAVILGMRAAARISLARGHLARRAYDEIEGFLAALPVPALPRTVGTDAIAERVKFDKKKRDGRVRFVLLKAIGRTTLDSGVGAQEVRDAVETLRG